MGEIKTKPTDSSVIDFLSSIEPEFKREDSHTLLKVFQNITGEKAVMWGTSIVGFGKYHYKSERSSQEGDWMLTGFSPRKQNLTLYIMAGNENNPLFDSLGKHKTSVGCLYIKRLSDIDLNILEKLIKNSYDYMKNIHTK